MDKASDAIKDKVKSAWQWLFGQQSVSGLGDPLSVTVVVTAIVVGAAVSAAIIFALQNHQKGATQTLDSLSKTKSALQRAREAGVISDDNYQAIVREVNQALVRENAAGARQQWWRSVGGVLKFVIPLSLGAWLILDGIPRLMRVQKK
ncbi:MAG: hypothetical protein KatS3mg031_0195 [Chitinophagales bacterium]|nr:MAG: hypothetical protein KatS3mg031_0195 [Chitinophagales bacterium]